MFLFLDVAISVRFGLAIAVLFGTWLFPIYLGPWGGTIIWYVLELVLETVGLVDLVWWTCVYSSDGNGGLFGFTPVSS